MPDAQLARRLGALVPAGEINFDVFRWTVEKIAKQFAEKSWYASFDVTRSASPRTVERRVRWYASVGEAASSYDDARGCLMRLIASIAAERVLGGTM